MRSLGLEEQMLFHNRLRILLNLSFDDMVAAGVIEPDDVLEWAAFQRNPHAWAINCDVAAYDRLWKAIQKRELH